ncbi:MAG TPA: BREX system P-loop protein BrxC, partial [Oribacterium sp.]|nr:BREX system P-loop protein BrxC [Oribacterium sp.]
MKIQNVFQEDINRKINGVVKVDQDAEDVLVQELDEYVITRDLKKHFMTFFNNYAESFHEETADIGVWISGFFGSGKSHFLKMLSYLLANREVQGIRTVERFRKKFADDPATFMLIDSVTKGHTDTILFNIDIEGSIHKDKTAVLRVFAKMFYNYLGFYGENLKVAKLEQFIEKRGKTAEFRRVFEEKNGGSWIESRDAFAFFEDDIVETLEEVLGMSEESARNWFNGTETVETSIAQLVSEMKEYVDQQPEDFRLFFMVDEVGQYVGGDTDLLINLQSLVEKIGSECGGKIWVVCTGQEAIDEIIKARENEFSRIQARFKTRLSLTSSSADEVIQKRILKKKPEVEPELEEVYNQNDSVLRNLFSFTGAMLDIKGFSGPQDFARNFPFVPYQFMIMQKVFAEIRKHGNAGKHLSGGERSMLSGFQEAAQKIEDRDEYALAPFYLFYNTVHGFLDSAIRRVIERCQKAADNGDGIEQQDVNVLKLLYLIRYVDDIPANLDNIVILMADDIRIDKITMRKTVGASLDRLLSQNYIGRTGDTYNFLTDEEQDIQRDIYKNTQVDTSAIVERIGQMIFADIYTTKKFRHGKYDFPFDQMIDSTSVGSVSGGMRLRILTVATDAVEKSELRLMT